MYFITHLKNCEFQNLLWSDFCVLRWRFWWWQTNREGRGERVDGAVESSKRPLAIAHCNKAESLIFISSYLFGWVDPRDVILENWNLLLNGPLNFQRYPTYPTVWYVKEIFRRNAILLKYLIAMSFLCEFNVGVSSGKWQLNVINNHIQLSFSKWCSHVKFTKKARRNKIFHNHWLWQLNNY